MWAAIGNVTTWVGLLAVLGGLVTVIVRERSRREERQILSAAQGDRAQLVSLAMERFHIDTSKLKGADLVTLGLAQLRSRNQRLLIVASALVVVGLAIVGAVIARSLSHGDGVSDLNARTPHEPILDEGTKLALVDHLKVDSGKSVRIVRVGDVPKANVLDDFLVDAFIRAGWHVEQIDVGMAVTSGVNFPNEPYVTAGTVDSEAVNTIYSACSGVGLEIHVAPHANAFGPTTALDAVIVIR